MTFWLWTLLSHNGNENNRVYLPTKVLQNCLNYAIEFFEQSAKIFRILKAKHNSSITISLMNSHFVCWQFWRPKWQNHFKWIPTIYMLNLRQFVCTLLPTKAIKLILYLVVIVLATFSLWFIVAKINVGKCKFLKRYSLTRSFGTISGIYIYQFSKKRAINCIIQLKRLVQWVFISKNLIL